MSLEKWTFRSACRARNRAWSALAAALLLLPLPACSAISSDGFGFAYAIVYGTVTDAAGAPVANATARVNLHRQNCTGTALAYRDASAGGGGRYRVLIGLPGSYQTTVCPSVVVTPPFGSGLRPRIVTGSPLVARTPATAADSVRIDVQLKP